MLRNDKNGHLSFHFLPILLIKSKIFGHFINFSFTFYLYSTEKLHIFTWQGNYFMFNHLWIEWLESSSFIINILHRIYLIILPCFTFSCHISKSPYIILPTVKKKPFTELSMQHYYANWHVSLFVLWYLLYGCVLQGECR